MRIKGNARRSDAHVNEFIHVYERKALHNFYRNEFDFLRPRASLERFQEIKLAEVWDYLIKANFFGEELSGDTLQFWRRVRGIYKLEARGEVLPLHQAIRLLDIYRLQGKQMATVESRMGELNALRKSLMEKLEQLLVLGESHAPGKRNLEQLSGDYDALERIRNELKGSFTRLEIILISAQKAAQSQQIRRELGDLSAKLPRTEQAEYTSVEAESLEDLERAIGREIETYLQLERETEAHLR